MLKENTIQSGSRDDSDQPRDDTQTIIGPIFPPYDPNSDARPVRTYFGLELAYEFFNQELFNGILPPCLITMQRKRGAYGYFSGDRFVNSDNPAEVTDEIALNPIHFMKQTPTALYSTLVHEMVHALQYHFGEPSRGGYHNKQWAGMMKAVGLVPSDTGKPGGNQTGERMSHFILQDGPFHRACQAYLASNMAVLFQDRAYREPAEDEGAVRVRLRKAASKTRYSCPRCPLNAWAKQGALLICGTCEEVMQS